MPSPESALRPDENTYFNGHCRELFDEYRLETGRLHFNTRNPVHRVRVSARCHCVDGTVSRALEDTRWFEESQRAETYRAIAHGFVRELWLETIHLDPTSPDLADRFVRFLQQMAGSPFAPPTNGELAGSTVLSDEERAALIASDRVIPESDPR